MSGHFEIAIQSGGVIVVEARIEGVAEASAFAHAWNAAVEGAYPDAEEPEEAVACAECAEDGEAECAVASSSEREAQEPRKRAPLRPIEGTTAYDVLAYLNQGIDDPQKIAERLGLAPHVAGSIKGRLISAGHWSPTAALAANALTAKQGANA
jgi:hypothetical protein